jgi:proline iminopeptidase
MFEAGSPSNILCYRFSDYNRLTMPILIIAGKYDGAVGTQPAKVLAQNLPHARYLEYENSAHFPYEEEPGRFARDVSSFFTNGYQ